MQSKSDQIIVICSTRGDVFSRNVEIALSSLFDGQISAGGSPIKAYDAYSGQLEQIANRFPN